MVSVDGVGKEGLSEKYHRELRSAEQERKSWVQTGMGRRVSEEPQHSLQGQGMILTFPSRKKAGGTGELEYKL